jgi:hypothetical protein
VFVTIEYADDSGFRQVDLVLSERAADRLAEALISGSVGVMRELDFSSDGFD